mmetsp:Transcript_52827/g.147104  ORF Transcript_52827/g.147104 Transcript_52827/m.147104 type:complete len:242 (-) Transcript_52827:61-786(-)
MRICLGYRLSDHGTRRHAAAAAALSTAAAAATRHAQEDAPHAKESHCDQPQRQSREDARDRLANLLARVDDPDAEVAFTGVSPLDDSAIGITRRVEVSEWLERRLAIGHPLFWRVAAVVVQARGKVRPGAPRKCLPRGRCDFQGRPGFFALVIRELPLQEDVESPMDVGLRRTRDRNLEALGIFGYERDLSRRFASTLGDEPQDAPDDAQGNADAHQNLCRIIELARHAEYLLAQPDRGEA